MRAACDTRPRTRAHTRGHTPELQWYHYRRHVDWTPVVTPHHSRYANSQTRPTYNGRQACTWSRVGGRVYALCTLRVRWRVSAYYCVSGRLAAVPPCRRAAVPPCRRVAVPPYRRRRSKRLSVTSDAPFDEAARSEHNEVRVYAAIVGPLNGR